MLTHKGKNKEAQAERDWPDAFHPAPAPDPPPSRGLGCLRGTPGLPGTWAKTTDHVDLGRGD